jgi:hypothetical protein
MTGVRLFGGSLRRENGCRLTMVESDAGTGPYAPSCIFKMPFCFNVGLCRVNHTGT